jgi:uncharacterized membrane protein YidH (DUF202 family)
MATIVSSTAADRPLLDGVTRLSLTRTHLSAERTLMSSIPASFAMISFGIIAVLVGLLGVLAFAGLFVRINLF